MTGIRGLLMRSILREFHASIRQRWNGPYYVTYFQGSYTLRPFRQRDGYTFRVLPLFIRKDCPCPEWVFEVLMPEQEAIASESYWQAMVDEKEKERRIANRKADR